LAESGTLKSSFASLKHIQLLPPSKEINNLHRTIGKSMTCHWNDESSIFDPVFFMGLLNLLRFKVLHFSSLRVVLTASFQVLSNFSDPAGSNIIAF
jgi:hypothetical protein